MNDHQFVSSVPRGFIDDPAAVAQQIAKQIRRSLVEAKPLCICSSMKVRTRCYLLWETVPMQKQILRIDEFVSSFEYSCATGEMLRQLCRVNPSKADTLMQHHKAFLHAFLHDCDTVTRFVPLVMAADGRPRMGRPALFGE